MAPCPRRLITGSAAPLMAILLLSISAVAEATCYIAAYGLVSNQSGYLACPGTATSPGGAETCCMPGSECGKDSLCRTPGSTNNQWYQAGCTDSKYSDVVCQKPCIDYATTYVTYDKSQQEWMCCGNGGCNGTVTDSTFQAVAPANWKVVTGGSSSSSSIPSTSTTATTGGSPTTTPSSLASTASTAVSKGPDRGTSSSNDSGLSIGAKAGIGVGVGVGAVALVLSIVAICMLRRRRQLLRKETVDEKMANSSPPSYQQPIEIDGGERLGELSAIPPVHEIGSSQYPVK